LSQVQRFDNQEMRFNVATALEFRFTEMWVASDACPRSLGVLSALYFDGLMDTLEGVDSAIQWLDGV